MPGYSAFPMKNLFSLIMHEFAVGTKYFSSSSCHSIPVMDEKVDWEALSSQYDKMGERPWRYMMAAVKKWDREVGAVLESFEMTRTQVEFLMCLAKFTKEGRPTTQKDVAAALGRAENTASGVFRGLETKGYIVRSASEADQRAKHIALT
jgi:hypothetical protein